MPAKTSFMDIANEEIAYDPSLVKNKKPLPKDLPSSFLTDPCAFVNLCWPQLTLAPYQREILYSVRDNVQTFVQAGNELGKDFISGVCVPWFFMSRSPCRIVTSSAGETQLKSVLWGEIGERLYTSRFKFPFRVTYLSMKMLDKSGMEIPLSYCLGHVTKSVENFQGHHLDHDIPRVLALFDEASGVADPYWEASQSWFHRALVIGNPLNVNNFFYRECKGGDVKDPAAPKKSKRLLRKVIKVGALDSPNVQAGIELEKRGYDGSKGYPTIIPGLISYEEFLRRQIQWDPIKQSMRLHGEFYEGEETLLYPPGWLDYCEEIYKSLHPGGYIEDKAEKGRLPVSLGVDPGEGGDPSAFTIVDALGLVFQHEEKTPDTMKIVQMIVNYMERFRIPARMIGIDAGGGGKQVADRLSQMGIKIRVISFGSAPTAPKEKPDKNKKDKVEREEVRVTYKNRRCEMYGLLREAMDPSLNPRSFALPVELWELREELAVHPLWYDDNGKMYLPPKDSLPHKQNKDSDEITIKKLLGRSPNRADSLVLANFVMKKPITRRKIGAR